MLVSWLVWRMLAGIVRKPEGARRLSLGVLAVADQPSPADVVRTSGAARPRRRVSTGAAEPRSGRSNLLEQSRTLAGFAPRPRHPGPLPRILHVSVTPPSSSLWRLGDGLVAAACRCGADLPIGAPEGKAVLSPLSSDMRGTSEPPRPTDSAQKREEIFWSYCFPKSTGANSVQGMDLG